MNKILKRINKFKKQYSPYTYSLTGFYKDTIMIVDMVEDYIKSEKANKKFVGSTIENTKWIRDQIYRK